jgi:hypothetical protein
MISDRTTLFLRKSLLWGGLLLLPVSTADARDKARVIPEPESPTWLGEKMPLPLTVETPADLAIKNTAERQYLIFNLLAGGKVAWQNGDFAAAATRWEQLLAVPDLAADVARVVKPAAIEARRRAGGQPATPVVIPEPNAAIDPDDTKAIEKPSSNPAAPARASVSGTVTGGGKMGPGGAVLWLLRKDGKTPKPKPLRGRFMEQLDKDFVPHILPVTTGTTVGFRNQDPIYHNVFSVNRPNDFDSGLFKQGSAYDKKFDKPGAVQILCNIHSSMLAYVVVLDSPWYGTSKRNGEFSIRGVPPGDYELLAWHEASSNMNRIAVSVGSEGVKGLSVRVGGDRNTPTFVPDKYGKPRQSQLGY